MWSKAFSETTASGIQEVLDVSTIFRAGYIRSLQIKFMGRYDPHSVGSLSFFKRREMVARVSEGGREPILMDLVNMLRKRGANMSENI